MTLLANQIQVSHKRSVEGEAEEGLHKILLDNPISFWKARTREGLKGRK